MVMRVRKPFLREKNLNVPQNLAVVRQKYKEKRGAAISTGSAEIKEHEKVFEG